MLQAYFTRIAMHDTVVGDVAVPQGTVVWAFPTVVRISRCRPCALANPRIAQGDNTECVCVVRMLATLDECWA